MSYASLHRGVPGQGVGGSVGERAGRKVYRSQDKPLLPYAINSILPQTVADFGAVKSDEPLYAYLGAVETFADMFTFARASKAWMVDSSGNLVEVASGVPRTDSYRYNGTSFVRKGIRLEREQRTNLDPNSDDLSAWTTSNTTIAKDQTGADGVANSAHSITATANGGTALEQITAASNPHVWSCLMKRITGTGTVEVTVNGGSTWVDVTNDIYTGAFVTASTGPGVTVTDPEFGVRLGTSGDVVAVQVSQLEQTSGQASSPIPTNGSAVTRAAETLTIAAAKMSYDSTAMWFQVQGEANYKDNDNVTEFRYFSWGTDSDNVEMDEDGNSNQPRFFFEKNNVRDIKGAGVGAKLPDGLNQAFNRAARAVSATEINIAYSGTAATALATAIETPDLSALNFALSPVNGSRGFMGHLALFRQGIGDPADAGLVEATS